MFGLRLGKMGAAIRSALAAWSPSYIFANGEQGAWYDPSDMSTLYQDAAGTTPVTAVEQPVGLMLDKSKGLVLGVTKVVNGVFDTDITGWAAGNPGKATLAWAAGTISITRNFAAEDWPNARTTLSGLTVGTTYKITSQVDNPLGLEVYHSITGTATAESRTTALSKTLTSVLVATATSHTLDIGIWSSSGAVGNAAYFDNISVKELPGNHASQATSTKRPVLSARVNLLTKTEDFGDAVWTKGNVTITANATVAPDGTLTADKLVDLKSTNFHFVQPLSAIAVVSGGSYTFTCRLKQGERGYGGIHHNDGTARGCSVNLATGALGAPYGGASASVVDVGDGWWKLSVTATLTAATNAPAVYASTSNALASYLGDGTSGIYIWGASLVPANQASLPYQRVNTATDYDTTGFPEVMNFDAVDDVHNVTFASALGSSCTVARARAGTTPVILTGQTIGTSYAASTDHAGLIIIDRALTPAETAGLTEYLTAKGAS